MWLIGLLKTYAYQFMPPWKPTGSALMYLPISGSKYLNPWLSNPMLKSLSFVFASLLFWLEPVDRTMFPYASYNELLWTVPLAFEVATVWPTAE